MLGFLTLVSQTLVACLFSFLLFILYASAVPLATTNTRPSYHITPEQKWMSDTQRPFLLGDEWHLYYLYNFDFDSSNPGSGGTEWYHITSTDMVHWTRRGVVLEKYKPNPPSGIILGDIETGSAVVDINNTAGLGRNAVVAIATQMPENAGVDLGTLECPDLYQIDLDDDSTKRTWIFTLGTNGYRYNRTAGSKAFRNGWMTGPDFYATVSWENPNSRYGSRYAIAWMNNWNYAASLPYYADFAGQQSLVREVKLKTINGSPTLVSIPIRGYQEIVAYSNSVSDKTITTDPASVSLPSDMEQGAYIIRATISKNDGDEGNEVRFVIKSDGTFSTTVGYDFVRSQAFLVRDSDGSATDSMAAGPKEAYDTVRTAPDPLGGSTVKLVIYVDWNSVEIFVNDGVAVLLGLIYPNQEANGVQVVSDTGSLTLETGGIRAEQVVI
ncbi:Levanbiose-producing levanase [Fusarium agapanthi]|uniref:Levanbiose-producing levanase n=1 Tax=Fusarium agapanthi TaxID=1803897 RepID=A0A9P5BMZ9_9HYPO|nr:Levanbiose-producing levanase [Fusarium agapanthi]